MGGMLAWVHLALRALQATLAIVILGLSGYVAHWYNADTLTRSPPQINFLIFVPIFSVLSIVGLELSRAKKFSHPLANLGAELFNMLFHFVGFISLATFLSKLLFCRGSVCMAARADAAMAGLAWGLWTASCGITAMGLFRGKRGVKLDKEVAMAEPAPQAGKPEKE